jgi:hypothetical protein
MKSAHLPRRGLLLWLLPALLCGCTSTPLPRGASIESLKEKAIVVLSVSHDLEGGATQNTIFYMDNESVRGRLVVSTYSNDPGTKFGNAFTDRFGQLMIFEVTPGRHRFDFWQVATGSIRLFPRSAPKPLEFEVRSGEAVYLGNLHARLKLDRRLLFGMKAPSEATPMVVDRSADDVRMAVEKMPALKDRVLVRLLPLGPWGNDDGSVERVDMPMPAPPVRK